MFFPKIVSKLRFEPLSFLQYKDNIIFCIFQISGELFYFLSSPEIVVRNRQIIYLLH
jgi:hypothetical protein